MGQKIQSNEIATPREIFGSPDLESTLNSIKGQKFMDFVNVKDFGAKGDGVTDDTDAFNDLIDYINNTSKDTININIPYGNYLILNNLNDIINKNINIMGNSSNLIINNDTRLRIKGNLYKTVNVTQKPYRQDSLIYVDDITNINNGDIGILIDSTLTWPYDTERNYDVGQTFDIISTGNNENGDYIEISDVVMTDDTINTEYTTNSKIKLFKPIKVNIKDLNFKKSLEHYNNLNYDKSFLTLENIKNSILNNLNFKNNYYCGIELSTSLNSVIKNCSFNNIGYGSNLGYGIVIYNSNYINTSDSVFYKCRRGVDLGGTTASRFCNINNNIAYNCSNSGFGGHANAQYNNIFNNVISKTEYGLVCRGPSWTIENNRIFGGARSIDLFHTGGKTFIQNNYLYGSYRLNEGDYNLYAGENIRISSDHYSVIIKDNYMEATNRNIVISGNLNAIRILNNETKNRQTNNKLLELNTNYTIDRALIAGNTELNRTDFSVICLINGTITNNYSYEVNQLV